MYPYLLPEIFGQSIPMYDVMIGIGVLAMLLYVTRRFERLDSYSRTQTNHLVILIIISLLFALLSSYLFDGIFHSIQNGEWSFGSITFIGGLIGGIVTFLFLLKYHFKEENKDIHKILNTLITGVVLAHAFGRIGCFLAGCCYGIPTEGFLGIIFPHGHSQIDYPGQAVYPTQLFESIFLFSLFFALNNLKPMKHKETEIYLIAYGAWRFLIEFIRGDDRGSFFGFIATEYNVFPTPSQYLSLLMIVLGIYLLSRKRKPANTP